MVNQNLTECMNFAAKNLRFKMKIIILLFLLMVSCSNSNKIVNKEKILLVSFLKGDPAVDVTPASKEEIVAISNDMHIIAEHQKSGKSPSYLVKYELIYKSDSASCRVYCDKDGNVLDEYGNNESKERIKRFLIHHIRNN